MRYTPAEEAPGFLWAKQWHECLARAGRAKVALTLMGRMPKLRFRGGGDLFDGVDAIGQVAVQVVAAHGGGD